MLSAAASIVLLRSNAHDTLSPQLCVPCPLCDMQVEEWAGNYCTQALLLADGVIWTGSATSALQQLAAGSTNALRALSDTVVLQLETVATALKSSRQQTHGQQHFSSGSQGKQPARAASTEARVLAGSQSAHGKDEIKSVQKPTTQQSSTATTALERPATPDTAELSFEYPASYDRSRSNSGSSTTSVEEMHSQGIDSLKIRRSWAATSIPNTTICCTSKAGLTQQQLRGLQVLIAAGICHREVAAHLVAVKCQGPADFEWGQQLRYYWQADTRQLQVGSAYCKRRCVAAVGLSATPHQYFLVQYLSASTCLWRALQTIM